MIEDGNIYTAEETRAELKLDAIATLENMRRRKIIKGFRQGREWYYTGYCIKLYLIAKGVLPCGENQDSLNFKIDTDKFFPKTGTSTTMTEKEVDASLRGVRLARKTMKQTSRSQASH